MDNAQRKHSLAPLLSLLTAALVMSAPTVEAKKTAPPKAKPHAARNAAPAVAEAPVADAVSAGQQANGPLTLAAHGATVLDTLTGGLLYEKNAYNRFYPASTTKILTALLVIEEGNLDREVVIQPEDTQVEPSAIGFRPGERYTRRALLYALMLKSANDVAQALARDNAGSIAAFAEKMTRRAASLGALDSHFANPHGLPNLDHYTTPHDLALIARTAMQQPVFRQIVGTVEYPWVSAQGVTTVLRNHNKLLWCPPWKVEGCTGLKTGYTVMAQQVLVSSALRNHREVISVVMHSDKPGIWVDSKTLLTYGLTHLPNGPRFD
ncbi:MAG: D-alanyl-D-alanine carboxypeptidase [Chthoniobacteraceae bacterium]|nr:D-alanyl-D-alanine carboxypeptidase [Chthoniobacteraceae bacterium]